MNKYERAIAALTAVAKEGSDSDAKFIECLLLPLQMLRAEADTYFSLLNEVEAPALYDALKRLKKKVVELDVGSPEHEAALNALDTFVKRTIPATKQGE
ncbi:hypothetical protein C5Y96_20050 [Blastopirellula marina]|uniref:Uncharacterized protein n=1 Tax=Blastopirellula marina TaxID=124 RepID=A0A2S8F3T3_9BACT|nr:MULTISPECIES: hypothetical protein [Pirellulaceae]PQO26777.1 hypothetical protein C5Y96_20050 [Blastopirellula marina]RCS46256.1 hypothetical protein DTL36_20080 [Bremerella cremea]